MRFHLQRAVVFPDYHVGKYFSYRQYHFSALAFIFKKTTNIASGINYTTLSIVLQSDKYSNRWIFLIRILEKKAKTRYNM